MSSSTNNNSSSVPPAAAATSNAPSKKMSTTSKKSKLEQLRDDLILGGTTGTIAKTMMAPVERVKILLQINATHPDVLAGRAKKYPKGFRGAVECAQDVYTGPDGFRGFWKGNTVNCLRYAPQQGSALAFNDAINASMPKYDSETQFWQSFGTKLAAGGISGGLANTICYPLDFARTRLASTMKGGKPQFSGTWDCISSTVRKQGITGLYTGWSVTVAGAFVYRAGQLGCFKQIQEMNPYKKDTGALGAVSGFCAVTVARTVVMPFNYPFDTIRRRMMMQSEIPLAERTFKGSVHCFTTILKNEGPKGLYKGLTPELFRGVGGSLVVVAYEQIRMRLNAQE